MSEEDNEVVRFLGNDDTYLIKENVTTIFSSHGAHTKGSSKLTLKNFVDFNWNVGYYRGQLIAIHIKENIIAYGFAKPATSEGLVRVVKRNTNERVLLKDFNGLIEDIGFAQLYEILMLACIDQSGTVRIFVVRDENGPKTQQMKVYPVFQINGDPSFCFKSKYLISWCQFVPEDDCLKELEYESTYKGKMLAIIRGSEVEIWHIGLASNFTSGPVYAKRELNKSADKNVLSEIMKTVIKIDVKDSDIISVSFSPDGTNIALAVCNGSVYFYQISFENMDDTPKCVFNWHPEELFLSLRSMMFLDNRKDIHGVVELWKYVVTLTNKNEIILWSCETWQRLQKLSFVRPYVAGTPMKLAVDGTGKYILLSDIDNNLLYVMELSLDVNSSKKYVKIVCVSEILLQSPMLNIIIVNAKIDHNDINVVEQINSDDKMFNSMYKNTTVINLFALQPKSIQEGQLIVPSPETTFAEQLVDVSYVESTSCNLFPKPPTIEDIMDSIDLTENNSNDPEVNKFEETNNIMHELSPLEVHNLVKEKLRLKGISLNQRSMPKPRSPKQFQNRKKNNFKVQDKPSEDFIYPQKAFDLNEIRENSPSNNEVQTIFKQHPEESLQYEFQHIIPKEESNDTYESENIYSPEIIVKEEPKFYSTDSVFNGSSISEIRQDTVTTETMNNGITNQIDDIVSCLQEITNQLKLMNKKHKKIDTQLIALLSFHTSNKQMLSSELCQSLKPMIMGMVMNSSDQVQKNLQMIMDHQLNTANKKIADIVKNSISNKIDVELFTRSLVASLSPTLDVILKDLFMSTVIPKFEHACCSMFKQIDVSFTERSLEYQNELKSLLNEEGNINYKLEYAFEKFKNDMSNIVRHSEKTILSAQNDMQKQFSYLLKEKSLSHVESYLNDTNSITSQYTMLTDSIEHGDLATAFEKALSASNLDLVLFVCEKVPPEELFLSSNSLKTPIVLSLIQQLSVDLSNNTELKHRYLDSAVGSLDYTNNHHKENINLVLIKMDSNIVKFMQQHPYHPYVRKLKMLQLAVKTIISSITTN